MLHVDIPTLPELRDLATSRRSPSVTLVLPTTPVTKDTQADRTAFGNLAREAIEQVREMGTPKRQIWPLEEQFDDIAEDDEFWEFQARTLIILATPDFVRTFRVPNTLAKSVEVSDRFNLAPLARAVAFPHEALALVLGQNGARLVEVGNDAPVRDVRVKDMPSDAASVARSSTIRDRSPKGRFQGSEGKNLKIRTYCRRIDETLRQTLAGRDIPLALIATEPTNSIYRSVNSYPHLLPDLTEGISEYSSDKEITEAVRKMLDAHYGRTVQEFAELYEARAGDRRATNRVTDAARAATFGGIELLAIDMDADLPGTISDAEGRVEYAEAAGPGSYNVLSEIAARAFLTGAKVVAVRRDDIPERAPLAAMLRYPV